MVKSNNTSNTEIKGETGEKNQIPALGKITSKRKSTDLQDISQRNQEGTISLETPTTVCNEAVDAYQCADPTKA